MDLLRSCYRTTMQFDQAGDLRADVQWYFADPMAEYFPTPHLFGSSNWTPTGYIYFGPGERWDVGKTWANGAPLYSAPVSSSTCGDTDAFTVGVPTDTPPIQYSADGVPTCCEQNPCATWYLTDGHGRGVRTINPGGVWVLSGDIPNESIWDSTTEQQEFTGFSGDPPCGGGLSTYTGYFNAVTLYDGPLVLESYDLGTSTSTWKLAPGGPGNPAFRLYWTNPP